MSNIVYLFTNQESVTTTLNIAEGTNNTHESVIKLVRKYLNDFKEFGLVRFEIRARLTRKHGGGDTEYAILNERQATLLLSYMRNSEIIRSFKIKLVKAFYEMEAKLKECRIEHNPDSYHYPKQYYYDLCKNHPFIEHSDVNGRSVLLKLLRELEKDGHQVDGAMLEFKLLHRYISMAYRIYKYTQKEYEETEQLHAIN